MAHMVEIVQYQKKSNGQVAFTLRCCGDQGTDHIHTMTVSDAADAVKRKASLDPQRDFIANQHEKALQAATGALDEIGMVTSHD